MVLLVLVFSCVYLLLLFKVIKLYVDMKGSRQNNRLDSSDLAAVAKESEIAKVKFLRIFRFFLLITFVGAVVLFITR